MENNYKKYEIWVNFIIVLMIISAIYFSNMKALLEVYSFNYKVQLLEVINEVNLDTNQINEYFNHFKKSYFIKSKKQVSIQEDVNERNVKPTPPALIEEESKTEEPSNNKDIQEINPASMEEQPIKTAGIIINDEIFKLKKIIIAGDSVAQSLEYGLKKFYPKIIENRARHSTGLTVPSYFDWGNGLKEYLTDSQNSNVLIFMVGANDAQDLYLNKRFLSFGSQGWKAEYKSRVIKIMDTVNEFDHIQKVIWIGQPIMKSKNFDQKMQVLNSIYTEAIQEKNNKKFLFLPTREIFSINGEYSAEIDNKVARASDGIHLGMYGTILIATKIKELLE